MTKNNTRIRILLILELLYRHSDEEHPLSTVDITKYLESKGVTVDRKTLYDDMRVIMSRDYDVVMRKSSPNKFFWASRDFEIPELKLLIDAVSSSRFITDKKSKELINKLSKLASEPQAELLKRHITATGNTKADNAKLYYIVDTVTDAINAKKKICFQYYEYNAKKEKVLRHDGEVYELSPYELYWNEDYYYVVGYSEKHENITAFRVDRLCKPQRLEKKAVPKPKKFKVRDYADKIFSMYAGEEAMVTLECENELMKYVIDRFGIKVKTEIKTEETFTTKVSVTLSPTFYSWVFQFGGKMRIVGPEAAVKEYRGMKECE